MLVSRYHSRLLAFCRHLLGSKEDAEDVLQEVLAAAFNAILADERPINVRPWLYRIARNRSLNHLRRIQAIGVDSMDVHLSENGATTADKVHDRERFRLLVGDIHSLPETQRTALVLREMDALSYEQIAEAMDTTVPGVKSLLVRARISLAEAAEARTLSCEDVRVELAEVAEGLRKRPGPLVRRHLRTCRRCTSFHSQLRHTNKALAALLPIGPLALLRKLAIIHLSHSAGTGSGATAAGATSAAAGQGAAVAGTAGGAALGGTGGVISAGAGAIASKAAGALAAAAIVTAGAVEATHTVRPHHPAAPVAAVRPSTRSEDATAAAPGGTLDQHLTTKPKRAASRNRAKASDKTTAANALTTGSTDKSKAKKAADSSKATTDQGRVQTQTDPTVLASPATTSTGAAGTSTDTTGPTGPIPAAPAAGSSDGGTTGPSGTTGPGDSTGGAAPAPADGTTPAPAGTTGPSGATSGDPSADGSSADGSSADGSSAAPEADDSGAAPTS
jgi:RNA polymerase sigma factor (sigma-70 family)